MTEKELDAIEILLDSMDWGDCVETLQDNQTKLVEAIRALIGRVEALEIRPRAE